MPSKEQFAEWKEHPVTQEFMKEVKRAKLQVESRILSEVKSGEIPSQELGGALVAYENFLSIIDTGFGMKVQQ
jgi:hypothetical protein